MLTRLIYMTKREVFIKARSPPASLPLKSQVTEQRTVKRFILREYRLLCTGKTDGSTDGSIARTNATKLKKTHLPITQ